MQRPNTAPHVKNFSAAPPPHRKATAAARFSSLPEDQADDAVFYTERLAEIDAETQKLQRNYQQQLSANRRAIRQLQENNTLLRGIALGHTLSGNITAVELEHLETRKFIDVRHLNRLTHELAVLQNDVAAAASATQQRAQRFSSAAGDAVTGNTSVALRIQKLEKRLDGLLAEQQSAAVVRDRYRDTLAQLCRENAHHEQSIRSINGDIDARRRSYGQLQTMFFNAVADHNGARAALVGFRGGFDAARRKKEKAVAAQRAHVERLLADTRRLERREAELHADLEAEQQRMADLEAEQQSVRRRRQRKQTVMERLAAARVETAAGEDPLADTTTACFAESCTGASADEERAAAFDEMFRDMMGATGTTTLEGLVEKYEEEYALRVQMKQQIRAEKQHAERLREENVRERKESTTRRLNGLSATTPASRCLRAELQTCVGDAGERRECIFQQSITLQQTMAEVMRRVDLLAHRIASFRPDIAIPHTEAENLEANLKLLSQKALLLAEESVGDARGGEDAAENVFVTLSPQNNRLKLPSTRAASSLQEASPGETLATSTGAASALCALSLDDDCGLLPSPDAGTTGASPCSSDNDEEAAAQGESRQMALIHSDEPLSRDQIKRLAAQVLRREKRRKAKEERRR